MGAALLLFRRKWYVLRALGICAVIGLGGGIMKLAAVNGHAARP